MPSFNALSVVLVPSLPIFWILWRILLRSYISPLRSIPGPSSQSWLYGHFHQISTVRNYRTISQWITTYGANCHIRWLGMMPCLWTVDPVTVNHIMAHSLDYVKPIESRKHLERLLGNRSILVSEGDIHRKQNPAFGNLQIRDLQEIFIDVAAELRDVWRLRVGQGQKGARMDVAEALSSASLEVIGKAGFGYRFGAINPQGDPNELQQAFRAIFKRPPTLSILHSLIDMFPVLNSDERTRRVDEGKAVANRVGMKLVQERKTAISLDETTRERDLLALLVKANMDPSIPESQRLSDDEVLAQIPGILVAGHETIATALAWCLHSIAQAPQIQLQLRQEALSVPSDTPSVDELDSLPYLDAVIRETLRLYPPATATLRVATQDDVLPISAPFRNRNGAWQHEIRIRRGNRIVISIQGMNQSPLLWGDDASQFRPERWEDIPASAKNIPGVWGGTLTFLSGAHGCMGYRFAVNEMKTIIFTLVRAFEFEEGAIRGDVERTGTFLQRPSLLSEPHKGTQLPLIVREHAVTF